jgi:hypothetical protein
MSFFIKYRELGKLNQEKGNAIWKYGFSKEDFLVLKEELQGSSSIKLDSRDAYIYYATWWTFEYSGGSPSKKSIYESIGGSLIAGLDEAGFYRRAKIGAQRLGVSWISKQNTLYFRTLLLQGGLPLKHMSDNKGHYLSFLTAVLELQPECIEDFAFNQSIIQHLPNSSRNEIIYENCLQLVNAILKGDGVFDSFFGNNDNPLKQIYQKLKDQSKSLTPRTRNVKPKIYWTLSKNENTNLFDVQLRLHLPDLITNDNLSDILGIDCQESEYQFFLNDELVCIFRKTNSGKYRTDWYSQSNYHWDGTTNLLDTYVICNGEKIIVNDFIQYTPELDKPTLWVLFSTEEYRLIKGQTTSNKNAIILHPEKWFTTQKNSQTIIIYDKSIYLTEFEGEIALLKDELEVNFKSGVSSFDWSIRTEYPAWLIKSNIPIVKSIPWVTVYDENDKKIESKLYSIHIRRSNNYEYWEPLNQNRVISTGSYELQINYNGIKATTNFFNIGNLELEYQFNNIDEGKITIKNSNLELRIGNSTEYECKKSDNLLIFKRSQDVIPKNIQMSLKEAGEKNGVNLTVESPLKGFGIFNNEGKLIKNNMALQLHNLNGHRIINNQKDAFNVVISNSTNQNVKIIKTIYTQTLPLIALKEDLHRLFYLGDAMDIKNTLKLSINSAKNDQLHYNISAYPYLLNIDNRLDNYVTTDSLETDSITLGAIPLNTQTELIDVIELENRSGAYFLPGFQHSQEFIIISTGNHCGKLMPRFVSFNPSYSNTEKKEERISRYHTEFQKLELGTTIWLELANYFNKCSNQNLPYSTFDQIRAIGGSSIVAAVSFLWLITQNSTMSDNYFIEKSIPQLEQELGFNFHWIIATDWEKAFEKIENYFLELGNLKQIDIIMDHVIAIVKLKFEYDQLPELYNYLNTKKIIITNRVGNSEIINLRSQLGARILNELPRETPTTNHSYNVPIENHIHVSLLLRTPIAVSESIAGKQAPLNFWVSSPQANKIRRNMQYAQFLNFTFYKALLYQTLNQIK